MQSWLPAQGSGVVVLRALPILLAIIHTQFALGFDGSLVILPDEPASTLDGHLPSQNLDLQETVLDFVGSGVLGEREPPIFRAPKSNGGVPQVSAPQRLTDPILLAPKQSKQSLQAASETKPTPPASPSDTESTPLARKPSPFRKWVRPQSSSPAKPRGEVTREEVTREEVTPDEVAPELARATPLRRLKPAPAAAQPRDESTAPNQTIPRLEELSEPKRSTTPKQAAPRAPTGTGRRNLPPLTVSQQNLRKKIRGVLTHYYNRPLNTRDRSPWELMHAMLAFEAHSKVLQGGPNGKPITAVGWLCYNQSCKRRTLMYVNDEGDLRVRVGPALQGHRGQLLAMLAQSRINENYPMLVEGHELKVKDLIEMEQRTCYPRTELTFKLIALMHYLDSEATWLNDQGMEWNIPRLISEEIRQPVRGAACGGTHRLSGLTLAYKTRARRGEPVDGEYLRAKKFVSRYQQYAYRLQNRDGSFSTEWFRGPGNEESLDRKLKTTGHILEWLLYAATDKELNHWRTTKAVNYLANIMSRNRYKDWEAGPLGHAIHALLVYDRLAFSPYDPPEQGPIAELRKSTTRRAKR